ncbi:MULTISPECIES: aldose epimerase family protein [Enterococcus]|uniref:Aldose 1-epimerase n=1 Tax=Candidatus Enterococcus mangumiae TaxID=2230878 RepID=A0ABZ2T1R5_9ENTE|nr:MULTISPECIES: aldose epimerase family protein [unclassified Enterococcus]MBO0462064.1 galactose mutarotase [Enterococcus sp. DIV1298c]MBO0489650.1 galactose mutarotase [Enterococcus sp. DIV1094]MBO1298467.1 galactose mutarotase [Enterococcus sp. DIV1271a]
MNITEKTFGSSAKLITLTNQHGTSLAVTDLGARIVSLRFNDRELVLGFDSAEEYLEKDAFIGATIGRTAGRIDAGKFTLAGQNYQLPVDPATGHSLHGSTPSFEEKTWSYEILNGEQEATVIFTMTSPDQEHGFPGNLSVEVHYTLTEDNIWRVTTKAVSDQLTLFNPTNHVYFNLSGDVTQPIDEHTLWVNSHAFAALRPDSIPTGEQVEVTGTPFDFQTPKKLSTVFTSDFPQKELFDGIDHPFFLKETGLDKTVATLLSPDETIQVSVRTDAPSIVIFTANFGEDTPEMRGKRLADHGGITFETQIAPGAERYPSFGDMSLAPQTPFETITEFKLKTREEQK